MVFKKRMNTQQKSHKNRLDNLRPTWHGSFIAYAVFQIPPNKMLKTYLLLISNSILGINVLSLETQVIFRTNFYTKLICAVCSSILSSLWTILRKMDQTIFISLDIYIYIEKHNLTLFPPKSFQTYEVYLPSFFVLFVTLFQAMRLLVDHLPCTYVFELFPPSPTHNWFLVITS